MRKIETREQREKRNSRNKLIIGLVLVVLMVFSSAAYAFFSRDDVTTAKKIEYNGIKFSLLEDGRWHGIIQNQEYMTIFNPKEAENVTGNVIPGVEKYSGKPLYFSYDSDREGTDEVSRNLGSLAERAQYVCIDECKEDWPVKNCASDNVIIIKDSNTTIIRQEEKCVYILAPRDDLVRASDAFIFKTLELF